MIEWRAVCSDQRLAVQVAYVRGNTAARIDNDSRPDTNGIIHTGKGGLIMLVLSRKQNERIRIGDDIEIVVVGIHHGRVRLGIKAPREMSVL